MEGEGIQAIMFAGDILPEHLVGPQLPPGLHARKYLFRLKDFIIFVGHIEEFSLNTHTTIFIGSDGYLRNHGLAELYLFGHLNNMEVAVQQITQLMVERYHPAPPPVALMRDLVSHPTRVWEGKLISAQAMEILGKNDVNLPGVESETRTWIQVHPLLCDFPLSGEDLMCYRKVTVFGTEFGRRAVEHRFHIHLHESGILG